tara:strand:+ start:99 stop:782 length:684 start_codon:yes stop_codon:yes gene_type:complete
MKRIYLPILIIFLFFFSSIVISNDDLPLKEGRIFIQNIVETPSHSTKNLKDHFNLLLKDLDFKHKETYKEQGSVNLLVGTAGIPLGVQTIINTFKQTNKVISNNDFTKLNTEILITHVTDYLGSPQILLTKIDLQVDIGEGRYRYTLSNFDYQHYLRNNPYASGQIPLHKNKHIGCKQSGDLINILECPKRKKQIKKSFNAINNEIKKIVNRLEEPILVSSEDNENW